jgi:hypothetical protein
MFPSRDASIALLIAALAALLGGECQDLQGISWIGGPPSDN